MKTQKSSNVDIELEEFWKNFHLFPSGMERYIFSSSLTLFGFGLLPYVIVIIGWAIRNVRFGTYEWPWSYFWAWPSDYFPLVGIVPIFFYTNWQSQVSTTFRWLLSANRVNSSENDLKREYLKYLTEYQNVLLSKTRWYFLFIIGFILVIPLNMIEHGIQRVYMNLYTNPFYSFELFTMWIFGILLWAYIAGAVAWPFYISGRYLFKLSQRFDINIQPNHPDGCGGLRQLGDFCLSMSLPIVSVGLVLATYAIGAVPHYEKLSIWANVLLFVFILPFTVLTFLSPLWNIHLEMVKQKKKHEDEYSNQVSQLEQQIRSYVLDSRNLEKAKLAKEQLEILQAIDPNKTGFPVWPFRYNIFLPLLSPQILGLVGTAISLYNTISSIQPKP